MPRLVEEWRDIAGHEGLYQVSDWGNVRSLNYNHTRKPQVLIPFKKPDGYLQIHIGAKNTKLIHKLIAEAFIPIPEELSKCEKLDVHHIDGNRSNNAVWNLMWIDKDKHNKLHFNGKSLTDEHKNKLSKAIEGRVPIWLTKGVLQFSKDGIFLKEYNSLSEAAREIGISHTAILNCCRQKPHCKTAGGFIWRYA